MRQGDLDIKCNFFLSSRFLRLFGIKDRHPDGHQRQTADHIKDGMLFCEDRGGTDKGSPHPGQHLQAGAAFCQPALRERQRHAAGTLAVDGRADIDRGIRLPEELHDLHRDVVAADGLRRGADVQTVGQYHIENEAEGHAGEHHQV